MSNLFNNKINWRNSPAHLLLLSKFRHGDSLESYLNASYWEDVLKAPPLKVIEQFKKDGVLEPMRLKDLVDYKFKVTELKAMLKKKELKVSGRKDELIERLIENDTQAMLEATKELDLYKCTSEGTELANKYLAEDNAKRDFAEQTAFNLLSKKEFVQAVNVIVEYEASRVFPRGLNNDWKNYEVATAVNILKTIFEKTPGILNGISEERLSQLRLAAGMISLTGTNDVQNWLPTPFETGIYLEGCSAVFMLVFHARHECNMANYRQFGYKTIEILGSGGGECAECQKIIGRKFDLQNAPELPNPKCTCETGCRCIAIIGDFE